jgi:hypothetical protein
MLTPRSWHNRARLPFCLMNNPTMTTNVFKLHRTIHQSIFVHLEYPHTPVIITVDRGRRNRMNCVAPFSGSLQVIPHFFVSLFLPFSNAFEVASLLRTSGHGCCFTARTRDTTAATGTTRRIHQAKNLPNPIRTEAVVGGNMEDCHDGLPRLSLRVAGCQIWRN